MTRKCKQCSNEIPLSAKSETTYHKAKFCGWDCMTEFGMAKAKKDAEKRTTRQRVIAKANAKEARQKHREAKERIKPIKYWYDKFQALVNQWVVHVRDKKEPCCTCGKSDPDVKYDAGHWRSRGACKELRFELTNIHKQCSVNCNQIGSGMRLEYEQFLIFKYGQDHVDWLKGPHPLLKDQYPHYEDVKKDFSKC